MLLQVLDEASIERIHHASLVVLERVGLSVPDDAVCGWLGELGAKVDEHRQIVKMPRRLVLESIQSAPSSVSLFDRHGARLLLDQGEPPHHFCSDFQRVIDLQTSQVRRVRLQDIADIARLADALPAMKGLCHQCLAEDVPAELAALLSIEAVVLNTTKHCLGVPTELREAVIWAEISEVVLDRGAGLSDTPTISFAVSTTSPLQFDRESISVLRYAAMRGIPIVTIPCPLAGGTTPFTLAGTLVVQNAENLFSVALSQLANQGAPVVYGGVPGIMDMRTGSGLFGTPEFSLMSNAVAQLARFYGLPSYSALGDTDALEVDIQCGAEKMLSYFSGFASGLNLSVGAGGIATAAIVSYPQLVVDSDLIQTVERYMRGFTVDQDTLALDAIGRVGPGGDYLTEQHTLTWLRRGEHYYPRVFNRQTAREGVEANSVLARAHARAREILVEHDPEVPADVSERIAEYVRRKSAELG